MQTPRRNGDPSSAGAFDLYFNFRRPFRTSWLIVGIASRFLNAQFPSPRQKERGIYQRASGLQQVFEFFGLLSPPVVPPPRRPIRARFPLPHRVRPADSSALIGAG